MSEYKEPETPKTIEVPKKKQYPISPYGVHVKRCIALTVGWNPSTQQAIIQKWLFKPEDFQCPRCKSGEDIVFMRQSLGVYKTCKYCGYTERVYAQEPVTGKQKAQTIGEPRIIGGQENIRRILLKYKMNPPSNFPPKRAKGRRKIKERLEEEDSSL